MKIALVHEFLIQLGGAEKALEEFHELYPEAPVFTLFYDKQRTKGRFSSWDVRTSFLQKFPGALKRYKWLLPLMPRAIESFDFSGYDVILSDSSAFAMGARKTPGSKHICYCHTPTRYVWQDREQYIRDLSVPALVKPFVRFYIRYFQARWDKAASARPDVMIANSKTVRGRIKKYYDREAQVIYPPVDTDFFNLEGESERGDYFLTGSRLEPYKKIDLVVEAFNQLGKRLKVVGTGTEQNNLKKKALDNVEFLGRVSDEELRSLYQGAQAFVFPALEDAGLMVLEALACGTPIVGLDAGGTAEFVRD